MPQHYRIAECRCIAAEQYSGTASKRPMFTLISDVDKNASDRRGKTAVLGIRKSGREPANGSDFPTFPPPHPVNGN